MLVTVVFAYNVTNALQTVARTSWQEPDATNHYVANRSLKRAHATAAATAGLRMK